MKTESNLAKVLHGRRNLYMSGLRRLLVLGCLIAYFPPGLAAPAKTPVAIVVNPGTPVESLTLAEVRKVFLGERQFWPSNLRVTLLVRAPVAREREVLLQKIYQMSEAQYRQYWIAKIFRAEITSGPKIVFSTAMTNELVAAIPGAIGSTMADEATPGLKVLRIDGKLPGENGYPLQ
jgi:hypothetical protein